MKSRPGGANSWRGFLFGVAIFIGIGLVGTLIPIRSGDVITSGGQALSSANDLYIFVEQNKLAWSENLWSFSLRTVKAWLTAASPPHFHRIDCTVYHITSKMVDENQAKGWHVIGALAPYRGAPHAFMGTDLNWEVFRWTGAEFSKLSPAERTAARSQHEYIGDYFKNEGWTQEMILPVRGTASHRFTLGGVPVTIQATQTTEQTGSQIRTTSKLELIRGDDPKSSKILYDFTDQRNFLTRMQYRQLVE